MEGRKAEEGLEGEKKGGMRLASIARCGPTLKEPELQHPPMHQEGDKTTASCFIRGMGKPSP